MATKKTKELNRYISFAVSRKSEAYPNGRLIGNMYEYGSIAKSKTISLSTTDIEIGYQMLELWAEDLSKKYDECPINKSTRKELELRINEGAKHRQPNGAPKSNARQQAAIFHNAMWFHAALDEGIKLVDLDKCQRLLQEGLARIADIKKKQQQEARKRNSAAKIAAKGLYEAFQKTGVDMSEMINDEKTLNEYKLLIEKEK